MKTLKNEFIRDITKVHPMSKSEARRRLDEIIGSIIDYISLKEGWEETGDLYREHFNLK